MKELVKNVIASGPLALAVGLGYLMQPFMFVAKQLSNLGIYAHEKLETKLGKQITAKRIELKKQMEILQEMQNRMKASVQEESSLSNTIKSNSSTGGSEVTGGNVFILGKKSTNLGSGSTDDGTKG